MITFTARLVARSMRWVAPLLVLFVWVFSAVGGGRSTGFELASVLFPAYLIVGTWLTIVTGDIDDDAHRDLLAAATGSASRLHLWRAATVPMMTGPVVVVGALLVAAVAQPGRSTLAVIAVAMAVSLSAIMVGVGLGTLLHRPLLRHRGLSVLIAAGGCVVVMLLSPIQAVHRSLNDDEVGGTWLLLLCATLWASVSTVLASQMAARRSR